jgi:regulator of RNase E activity RraA
MAADEDEIRRRCAEVQHLGTGPISDAMELMGLPRTVSTRWTYVTKERTTAVVGPAYTVRQASKSRARPHDENLTRQREASASLASVGEVIVIDMAGRTDVGSWGENQATMAKSRGIAGLVVNGAIRDREWIERSGFPALCRGFSPVSSRWDIETVAMNEPVSFDGLLIRPGDVIYADGDGLIVIARQHCLAVFERAEKIQQAETARRAELFGPEGGR